jgi:Exostosin family
MPDVMTSAGLAVTVACAVAVIIYESLAGTSIVEALALSSSSSSTAGGGESPHSNHFHYGAGARVTARSMMCDSNGVPLVMAAAASATPLLNDRTIELSPCVYRPWLMNQLPEQGVATPARAAFTRGKSAKTQRPRPPPFKVLLTNFGWNHPDQGIGLNVTRTIRSRELLLGTVNHPYFDPIDWDEMNRRVVVERINRTVNNDDDPTRYYVFMDVETCYESNYPIYGGGFENNLDTARGRVGEERFVLDFPNRRSIRKVLASPLFRSYPNRTKLVFLDCYGDAMEWHHRQKLLSKQFGLVSISAAYRNIDNTSDQGLPPPPVNPIVLTTHELRDIATCNAESNRTYLFSFVGSVRNDVREELIKLHNKSIGVISLPLRRYLNELATNVTPVTFPDLLRGSVFAGAPAGDNLFSYRFAEVLTAGAIPVVHSDGWVLPFRHELVDWSECLLHLPESSIPDTIAILNNITAEQRCRMRQRCLEIYNEYMSTGEGTIRGILEGLERVAKFGSRDPPQHRRRHLSIAANRRSMYSNL